MKKMLPSRKVILAMAVVFTLLLVVSLAAPAIKSNVIRMDPVNHLMYSFTKTSQETSVQTSSTIGMKLNKEGLLGMGIFEFSADEEAMFDFANSLLENLTFVVDEAFEINTTDGQLNFRGDTSFDMKYSGKSLLNYELVIDQWNWLLKSELMHSQPFLLDINKILNQVFDYSLDGVNEININEYKNILLDTSTQEWKDFEKSLPVYETHLRAFIEPRLVEKGETHIVMETHNTATRFSETIIADPGIKYEISFDLEEYYEFYAIILREAETDAELKELIRVTAIRFLEHAIETKDYELFALTTEEMQTALNKFNNEWDTSWDEAFVLILESVDMMQESTNMAGMPVVNYTYGIYIDSSDRIRRIDVDMNLGFMSMDVVVVVKAFGENVEIKSVLENENAIEVHQLIENPVMGAELGAEVATNFVSNFFSSEGFAMLLNDVKENSNMLPEEERDMITQSIDMMLMQIDMMLPMLLQQMGM
ncbi:MAG: hypothetical protein COA82_02620 [Alkaliphilus sp.]|nr:hypothetical protein [bacterium AH-315-L21]MBN4069321.1 hypothetical protein [bacterium AH-315-G05]PHS35934.1 MAG: hypothetical protein COA82_02620 [Alkaliphilus sp.]